MRAWAFNHAPDQRPGYGRPVIGCLGGDHARTHGPAFSRPSNTRVHASENPVRHDADALGKDAFRRGMLTGTRRCEPSAADVPGAIDKTRLPRICCGRRPADLETRSTWSVE